ncbi:MAG TPA: alkaline phosphatase [Pirellulaceae bacterium]|nr:alkaline phosphatase [Pirellulaceae bacterium]
MNAIIRFAACCFVVSTAHLAVTGTNANDCLRELQERAVNAGRSDAAHWGIIAGNYSQWTTHTNRLIPVYTFGTRGAGNSIDLLDFVGAQSVYRDQREIIRLYGRLPAGTLNEQAIYMDQTNVFDIQQAALKAGKKHIFLVIFDGMDWQTTRATSIYNQRRVSYHDGRGQGTHFQGFTADGTSQFGWMVTATHNAGTEIDVNQQTVTNPGGTAGGGYDASRGGAFPWSQPNDLEYLTGSSKKGPERHPYTDSACAATSMVAGVKTYNGAINVSPSGKHVPTIAHRAQLAGYGVGAVSSVPISHATPAATYGHNVHRDDLQDLTRDLLGIPSISHPIRPLAGLDVLIGGGFGVERTEDAKQGSNFVPGNAYLTAANRKTVDIDHGGRYVVATRTAGKNGAKLLQDAATHAAHKGHRLLGFFGVSSAKGHLPFATANGDYQPALGRQKSAETYDIADLIENPTLAEMTTAALTVLQTTPNGFWLMVEAGDVDWSNHDNNLDNSIGAINSGDAAVKVITDWVRQNSNWRESLMIVTADHGHLLNLTRPELLVPSH